MPQVLKEEVRNRILAAATTEFFEKGFESSSLRNMSKVAGITPGNLYRYYESKECLYEAVVGESYNRLRIILEEFSDNKIRINENPTKESIYELQKKNIGELVSLVIKEVVKVFDENRMGLLILLRDNTKDTRIGLLDWFKAHFELIYGDLDIAEYLAFSFTEGIIKLALKEDDELGSKAETFVKFFFVRGVDCNE